MKITVNKKLIVYFARFNKTLLFEVSLVVGMVFWTAILYILYSWAAAAERQHFTETVKLKAESLAEHTQALRKWIGKHGGIYVEVNENLKPIPQLSSVPERDVETPSGRKLTLFNSPTVLSHIAPNYKNDEGDRIHLVSSHPMNPLNLPDRWEKRALAQLDKGTPKAGEFIYNRKQCFYRLMYPMKLEPKCLNCHHMISNTPKKVIGGLSVSVDKTPYDQLTESVLKEIRKGYFSIWVVGLVALALFKFTGMRLLQRIEIMATHDSLTQLYNRRQIESLLQLECKRADRYGSQLSIILLDIDHFKKVNDTYGHPSGDEALRAVSKIIRQTIRETDIAGRYGGEEFIILVPNASCDGTEAMAERLRNEIKTTSIQIEANNTISVSVSMGVACFSTENNTPEQLVKCADEVLYQAKETGRDRICIAKTC